MGTRAKRDARARSSNRSACSAGYGHLVSEQSRSLRRAFVEQINPSRFINTQKKNEANIQSS